MEHDLHVRLSTRSGPPPWKNDAIRSCGYTIPRECLVKRLQHRRHGSRWDQPKISLALASSVCYLRHLSERRTLTSSEQSYVSYTRPTGLAHRLSMMSCSTLFNPPLLICHAAMRSFIGPNQTRHGCHLALWGYKTLRPGVRRGGDAVGKCPLSFFAVRLVLAQMMPQPTADYQSYTL